MHEFKNKLLKLYSRFLQNHSLNKLFDILVGCPGLEPGTNRLKAEYSTIELATH